MKEIKPINEFLNSKSFAIAGISRNEKKFGNYVYKKLKKRDMKVLPISPYLNSFDGDKCYKNIKEASSEADAVIGLVNKRNSLALVKEAYDSGIKNIWLQQGTETDECIAFCKDNNINLVYGECIIMYTDAEGFPHNLHRFMWKVLGLMPK